MRFLMTERGDLLAAKYIVRIGPLNSRPQFERWWRDVDYVHGDEARSTTASERAVQEFLDGGDWEP